jgi:hypothetical protein
MRRAGWCRARIWGARSRQLQFRLGWQDRCRRGGAAGKYSFTVNAVRGGDKVPPRPCRLARFLLWCKRQESASSLNSVGWAGWLSTRCSRFSRDRGQNEFPTGFERSRCAAAALDVIGNNVANASTVGFKSAQRQLCGCLRGFAGYRRRLAGRDRRGRFGDPATVHPGQPDDHQQWLDLAINGGGFFRMSDDGAISYTRNGQFHIDNQGYVINDQKLRLTGYPADAWRHHAFQSGRTAVVCQPDPPRATSDPLLGKPHGGAQSRLSGQASRRARRSTTANPDLQFLHRR